MDGVVGEGAVELILSLSLSVQSSQMVVCVQDRLQDGRGVAVRTVSGSWRVQTVLVVGSRMMYGFAVSNGKGLIIFVCKCMELQK